MGLGVAETVADAVVAAAGASVATDETGSAFFQGLVLGSGASTYFTGAGGEAVVDAPEPVGNIRFNIIGKVITLPVFVTTKNLTLTRLRVKAKGFHEEGPKLYEKLICTIVLEHPSDSS